jgi:hypothetical protein
MTQSTRICAGLILLSVSPDFIASDCCYSTELRLSDGIVRRWRAKAVPVILRPVDWRDMPFSQLLALPTDGKPISTRRNSDEAYLDVTNGIRRLLDGLNHTHQEAASSPYLVLARCRYHERIAPLCATSPRERPVMGDYASDPFEQRQPRYWYCSPAPMVSCGRMTELR